jgi:hypothetical protein
MDGPDHPAKMNQSVAAERKMAVDDIDFFKGQRICTEADGQLDDILLSQFTLTNGQHGPTIIPPSDDDVH